MATEAIIFQQIVDINWDQAIYTASPNNTVNVVQFAAKGSGTNIAVALTPKGTGYISAHVPDGTATGGNARGTRSVDLQTARSLATHVASGASATLLPGSGSLASGSFALTGSNQNRAIADASFVWGQICTAESAATNSIVAGNTCSASTPNSFSIGDRNQTTGGAGVQNQVSLGALARTYRENMIAVGCWTQFNDRGYVQGFMFPLRVRSSGSTPIDLVSGGSQSGAGGNVGFSLTSGTTFNVTIEITGAKSDGTAIAYYTRKVRVQNIAGTTTLVRVETIGTDDASGTSISITADNATDTLKITVTGVAGETWNWGGWVYGLETRVA